MGAHPQASPLPSCSFTVDVDGLDATVGHLARCGADLGTLLCELTRQVAGLHTTWEGEAAAAHEAAQAEWEAGCHAMTLALDEMRQGAATAHGNYTAAVETNVSLWSQVS